MSMLGSLKEKKNHYDILEVPLNATLEEIKEGHTRAKNAYSEDSLALYSIMTSEERNRMLLLIEEAFEVISSTEKRNLYDQEQGINCSSKVFNMELRQQENQMPMEQNKRLSTKPNLSEKNITKIVANNKYQLDYERNDEFEHEIMTSKEYSGKFLTKIREYKNVTILRMAEMTRISKGNIRGIEAENLEHLPAIVYVRGFVYQYAKCLKLNPELVASSYTHRLKMITKEEEKK